MANSFINLLNKIEGGLLFILKWGLWILGAILTLGGDWSKMMNDDKLSVILIIATIWLWATIRWIYKKYKRTQFSNIRNETMWSFLLRYIIAPVIVSIIVFSITGQSSLTIISVPILGIFSLNFNL